MAEDREPFLKRWARLKAEKSQPEPPQPAAEVAAPAVAASPDPAPQVRPEDLPPIEELTADSDFTPFLKEGVPEELKRLALRKLWLSDPVFANLDGLVEYGEDFGAAFRNPGPVATLFRLGRGMPGPGDDQEAEQEPEQAAQVPQPPAAEGAPGERSEPLPEPDQPSPEEASKDRSDTTG